MLRSLLVLPLVLTVSTGLRADDWPQWRGPDRTSISREKGLLKELPKNGPPLLWSTDQLGAGYSGPAVVGDRLFLMGSDENGDLLMALDVKTGKRLWATPIGEPYSNPWGGGPRGTPTVVGDLVYAIAAKGNLVCAEVATGKLVWTKSLVSDLGGSVPFWGYSESPLVDGDAVLCTPGGSKGTIASLDRKTGSVNWQSAQYKDAADYSSLVISTAHKSRQVVQMAAKSIGGVDIATGKLLWRFPREQRITIPTPVVFDNFVYITSGYGVGCNLLELTSPTSVREVYANKNMVNHHGGVILLDGHIYGYSDNRGWVCQNVKSGEVVWSFRKFPKGSIVYADGSFYCYAETDGTLAKIEASTSGWKEQGRFTIPQISKIPRSKFRSQSNFWTHPVIANGRLYLRDQELLFCFDVSEKR